MNWREILAILLGAKKPELIPIPVTKQDNQDRPQPKR